MRYKMNMHEDFGNRLGGKVVYIYELYEMVERQWVKHRIDEIK